MKCKMGMWSSLDSTFKKIICPIISIGLFIPFIPNDRVIKYYSIAPVVEKYKLKSTGSTSMSHIISVLADDFMSIYPDYIYEKSENGSGSASLLVKSGNADIGDMSRNLKNEEMFDGLESKCIALDGIVVILNDKNPINNLTMQNLRDIFSKKVTDWSEISDKYSGKIISIGREDASGTREGFESGVGIESPIYDIILSESGDIAVKCASEERSIGYISMASISDNIHPVKIDNIECNSENIRNKSYPLVRQFLQIYSKLGKTKEELKILEKWLIYLNSDRAKKLIEKENLVYA